MTVTTPQNPASPVNIFFGKILVLNIPFLSKLTTPTSLLTWIVALLAIMPWVVSIVCIFVILMNVIKWVKSNGNEKEIESAKTGIKRAIVGFVSMFILFVVANIMSNIFAGVSFDRMIGALALCKNNNTYVFEYAKDNNLTIDVAYKICVP